MSACWNSCKLCVTPHMDPLIRHLREGVVSADAAACALLVDDLSVAGGVALLHKAITLYHLALCQQRSQASHMLLIMLDSSPSSFGALNGASQHPGAEQAKIISTINLHSDPWGWRETEDDACNIRDTTKGPITNLDALLQAILHTATSTSASSAKQPPRENQQPHHQHTARSTRSLSGNMPEPAMDVNVSDGVGEGDEQAEPLLDGGGSETPESSSSAVSGIRHLCVVLDSLSALYLRYPAQQVLSFLDKLRHIPEVSCILTLIHQDLHAPQITTSIEHMATCVARSRPLTQLHAEAVRRHLGKPPHGRFDCLFKRRTGRVRAEQRLYTLLAGGDVDVFEAPPGLDLATQARLAAGTNPGHAEGQGTVAGAVQQATASSAHNTGAVAGKALGGLGSSSAHAASSLLAGQTVAAAATGLAHLHISVASQSVTPGTSTHTHGAQRTLVPPAHTEGRTPALSSAAAPPVSVSVAFPAAPAPGIRFELSEQEKAAREQVVLPWRHAGEGKAYATDDFKAYLPPAAGGHGVAVGGSGDNRLGHILYVRDSEGEHDSDEDPDDDLDF